MSDCRSVSTPIIRDSGIEVGELIDENFFPYRQVVGGLMYLMCGTRPDIAYSVSVASRKLENPTDQDAIKVKRILRYLKDTIDFGIIYKNDQKRGTFISFSDADHGGDVDTGRSTIGVICLYAGGPISWLSQRQVSVAISTTEAEVVAASEASREIIWLKRLFSGLDHMDKTPELYIDNEAAIRLAKNPEYHRRTKHIKTRHFFVRELVTNGELEVKKVDTSNQLADIMTKPLGTARFCELRNFIGVAKLLNEGEC